jgi:hypothetical protein
LKLIICNGRELEVRDLGPPLLRLRAGAVPIKINGHLVVEDDEARRQIAALLATGLYQRE